MAGFAYKYLAFLITMHVLIFSAQANGFMDDKSPDNRHEKFVDQFAEENITEQAAVNQDSGIIAETFSPIASVGGLIDSLVGILVSPYSAINATQLPQMFQMLFQALIGLSEIYVGYKFATGGA